MRKFVIALALVLTTMCGVAAAETFSGLISTRFEGLGSNFQEIQVDGKWLVIGCGPDSVLSEEVRAYLEERWDKTGSVNGEVVADPHFGMCIGNPTLAEIKPKAVQPSASSKLSEHGWIKLPDGLTAEELEIVETSLTDIFWDPVYQVPARDFVGVCRYFHERGFSVDVDFEFVKFGKPQQGADGYHKVTVTVVNQTDDIAVQMPLLVLYTCPPIQDAMMQRNGDNGSKSFVYMNDMYQTDRYSQKDWRVVTPADWLVIMKAIIQNGYVQEG